MDAFGEVVRVDVVLCVREGLGVDVGAVHLPGWAAGAGEEGVDA